MVIPNPHEASQRFLERLSTLLSASPADAEHRPFLLALASHLCAQAPLDELASRADDVLRTQWIAFHDFLAAASPSPMRVLVRSRTVAAASHRTVIDVACPDMPFLVDSITMEVHRAGLHVSSVMAESVFCSRDAQGRLLALDPAREATCGTKEAVIEVEADAVDAATMTALEIRVRALLEDIASAVRDFMPMVTRVLRLADQCTLPTGDASLLDGQLREFLFWLTGNHFTFLAMREYRAGVGGMLEAVEGSARGVIRREGAIALLEPTVCVPERDEPDLRVCKSPTRSHIHRPAHLDVIQVRWRDTAGDLLGEVRIAGLFTSRVFNNSPAEFPVIARRLRGVIDASGLEQTSHDGKRLVQILETLPREELLSRSTRELAIVALEVLRLQDRRRLRLFLHQDSRVPMVSCLIYAPRENYSTALRLRFQAELMATLGPADIEFNAVFTEGPHVRLHLLLRLHTPSELPVDVPALEQRCASLARTWMERLRDALLAVHDETTVIRLCQGYGERLPASYREQVEPAEAVVDLDVLAALDSSEGIVCRFSKDSTSPDRLSVRIARLGEPLPVSDALPMLENFGVRVVSMQSHGLDGGGSTPISLHAFSVVPITMPDSLESLRAVLETAWVRVWCGDAENDGFNRLILLSGLTWREVNVLRAVARYLRQIRVPFGQTYMMDTLVSHPAIARDLVTVFCARFDPVQASPTATATAVAALKTRLDAVTSLEEDRILRRFLDVLLAMTRTNAYRPDKRCQGLSFKLEPRLIPDVPKPVPVYEIFVWSPRVEGVHLRGGKVARGGIRWSDRREDYRTEVLGLVKAQQVKNAVIVPVGAKGGFFPRRLPPPDQRDAMLQEAIAAYSDYMRGLLDVTDNWLDGAVVPPPGVMRHDDDDPYLVVAADKGTATFSDIANRIAAEYDFWLGDAFASGGSAGYDHKGMGITARGAWVSVQAHFRQRGVDVQRDAITVVGIGDMSGDVFGNGLLQSAAVKLVAAFDHRHVFIDPSPDAARAFAERQRLFALARSSWDDYDSALISAGGGVFSRAAKSITVTDEMRRVFDIGVERMTPAELIAALLRAPVDLIWNGGIGTYIKAVGESHSAVGDRANDAVRVDGRDVRAHVFAEGGNLGMTQAGRIEYALRGGACNTDFIDNSAGVDCSDHEVNIKILLDAVVRSGRMTLEQRNPLLAAMTDEVASLVLDDNHRQTRCISLAAAESVYRIGEYRRYIQHLVAQGKIDRALESLPDDETLAQRAANGQGLMRPEIAMLLSNTKALLKETFIKGTLPDDPDLHAEAHAAFPARLVAEFPSDMAAHRLSRELVATQVANDIVNVMGITFVFRMEQATGASAEDIARAFVVARDVFDLSNHWQAIEQLEGVLPAREVTALLVEWMRLIRRAVRWLLRTSQGAVRVGDLRQRLRPRIERLVAGLSDRLPTDQQVQWRHRYEDWQARGVLPSVAASLAGLPWLGAVLPILHAAEAANVDASPVARQFFEIGDRLGLPILAEEINRTPVLNHWQAMAREGLRDDLDWHQQALTLSVLAEAGGGIDAWVPRRTAPLQRWERVMSDLRASEGREIAMLAVVMRELGTVPL